MGERSAAWATITKTEKNFEATYCCQNLPRKPNIHIYKLSDID
jgi:hypothetical protein